MICSYITGLILHKRVQRHVTQFSCLNDVEKIFWEGQKCETEFTWSRDYTPNVDLYHHSFKKSFDTYPCDIIAIFKSITMWHTHCQMTSQNPFQDLLIIDSNSFLIYFIKTLVSQWVTWILWSVTSEGASCRHLTGHMIILFAVIGHSQRL